MTQTAEQTTSPAHWVLCAGCQRPVFGPRLDRALGVCPECEHHHPLTADERLSLLADPGTLEPLHFRVVSGDPLSFTDTTPYPKRLERARTSTGMDEAVLCARAEIGGVPAVLAVMDFRFLGGSLGTAVGELITQAAETSLAERAPLIIVASSGGARMQEGALSLMQMAKTSAALGRLDEEGVLTVSLVCDPTYGGVAASFATLTDVIMAEPGARLGFAGRRVIEQTIRQELPPEFQTAEFLLERGFIDIVTPRPRLRRELGRLLRAASSGAHGDRRPVSDPAVRNAGSLPEPHPWDQVVRARSVDRPTLLDYLGMAFEDFQELRGDRVSGDCPAMVGGTAWLDGRPVVVVGQQKGHDLAELTRHNFGMAAPAGYRKAGRLMRMADKLGLPVVTLVDTPGAYPGADAEEQGQAVAIAENLKLMSALRVPVICAILGEGGSGGALGIAVANQVLVFSNSVYSVITPEGCAAIVWKDPTAAPRAAAALRLNSRDLLRFGVVDGVIPEPPGGTGADPIASGDLLRDALSHELDRLTRMGGEALRSDRRARFRQFGSAVTLDAEISAFSEGVR
ncbi:acetyl-CoA carboxylase, carboxyltransferase subunit beta [Nocardiopsis nanhaiensis]